MSNLYAVMVERNEVEELRFNRVLGILKSLEKTPNFGFRSLNITFSGYDDIPDEIFEIDDIRRWADGLIKKCPHLFYFLESDFTNCSQNILTTISDITMFYMGERKSIIEWVQEGYTEEALPKMPLEVRIPEKKYKLLEKGLKEFGKRKKVFKETKEVIKYLQDFRYESDNN